MKYDKVFLLSLFLLLTSTVKTADEFIKLDCTYIVAHMEKLELEALLTENDELKNAIGLSESSSNCDTINEIGAMGMWQFMPSTLNDLGFEDITPSKFKDDPTIFPLGMQLEALNKKMDQDLIQLKSQWFRSSTNNINYIEEYVGKEIKGVKITLAGLIGACHIGGVYGTMKFLDSGGKYNPKDSNGTNILAYLTKFSGYKFHDQSVINKRLTCLRKNLKECSEHSIPLKERLSSYSSDICPHYFLEKEIVTTYTSKTTTTLQRSEREISYPLPSLLDLKPRYRNITGLHCSSEVVPRSSIVISQVTDLERSNGIMLRSGKDLCMYTQDRWWLREGKDYFNSTLSRYSMLRGISKYFTYSPNFTLAELTTSLQKEVGLVTLVDRKKLLTFKFNRR